MQVVNTVENIVSQMGLPVEKPLFPESVFVFNKLCDIIAISGALRKF